MWCVCVGCLDWFDYGVVIWVLVCVLVLDGFCLLVVICGCVCCVL